MNKREFNALLGYISTRPDEAMRLRRILLPDEHQECSMWIGCREVGRIIGKCESWVRAHIQMFPSARRVKYGSRYTWRIKKEEVKAVYDRFINSNII